MPRNLTYFEQQLGQLIQALRPYEPLPPAYHEAVQFALYDWDNVDRDLLEYETQGGA